MTERPADDRDDAEYDRFEELTRKLLGVRDFYSVWVYADGNQGEEHLGPYATERDARAALGDRNGSVWRGPVEGTTGECIYSTD